MDEPTSALDVLSEQKIIDYIKEITSEKIIILVTHREKLLHCCDRVITLS